MMPRKRKTGEERKLLVLEGGRTLQVAQHQEQCPYQAHSDPLYNTWEGVPGAYVIQPAVNTSP